MHDYFPNYIYFQWSKFWIMLSPKTWEENMFKYVMNKRKENDSRFALKLLSVHFFSVCNCLTFHHFVMCVWTIGSVNLKFVWWRSFGNSIWNKYNKFTIQTETMALSREKANDGVSCSVEYVGFIVLIRWMSQPVLLRSVY